MEYQNEKNRCNNINNNSYKPKPIPEIHNITINNEIRTIPNISYNNYNRMNNLIPRNPFPAPRLYKPLYNRVSIYYILFYIYQNHLQKMKKHKDVITVLNYKMDTQIVVNM